MHRRQEEYGYLDLEDLIDDDGDPEKQGRQCKEKTKKYFLLWYTTNKY